MTETAQTVPTEADIRAALNTIADPCSRAAQVPVGIADMGLVRRLAVTPVDGGARITLTIGVTEYGCLLGPAFALAAEQALEQLPGVVDVIVDLDTAFDWTPDDMSAGYREHLASLRGQHLTLHPVSRDR